MTTFVNSISGVLVILVMVMVGYVLAKKGWFDDQTSSLIAQLVQSGFTMLHDLYDCWSFHG
ncbi:membrane transport protein [Streptococcus pasteurianus]|nr:membrane transport protein [Streptococcus pasteurianus]